MIKCLCIDDNSMMRLAIDLCFNGLVECQVCFVPNEEIGIKTYLDSINNGEPFDIVAIDTSKTHMDGRVALKEIKKINPNVKTITISDANTEQISIKILKLFSDIDAEPISDNKKIKVSHLFRCSRPE